MIKIEFSKYQGCGNDFVLIDNRRTRIDLSSKQVRKICDRRFGIGADGLMLLTDSVEGDFSMVYYNSDGDVSSFCGNGGRCIVRFAVDLGIIKSKTTSFIFDADTYTAKILSNSLISLQMHDVEYVLHNEDHTILDTGSPHYVCFTDRVDGFDFIPFAKDIRYSKPFPKGVNVNIVQKLNSNTLKMRTYERGVEDETLSCGTGATAVAIAFHDRFADTENNYNIQTRGGNFKLSFDYSGDAYKNIQLIGNAEYVFQGVMSF